jgi:hypothetical protein
MTMCVMPHCLAMATRLRAAAPPEAELRAFKANIVSTYHTPE